MCFNDEQSFYIDSLVETLVAKYTEDMEDRLVENISIHLDDAIKEIITDTLVKKMLTIHDNIDSVLNLRDDDEIIRKLCAGLIDKEKHIK